MASSNNAQTAASAAAQSASEAQAAADSKAAEEAAMAEAPEVDNGNSALLDSTAVTALQDAGGINIHATGESCDSYQGDSWFNKGDYGIYVNTDNGNRFIGKLGEWIWTCALTDGNKVYRADCPGDFTRDWDSCML